MYDASQDEILKQLIEAQNEGFDRLEKGSNLKWQGLFIDPLPQGTPDFFKTPAGKYLIDVIPFIVATNLHFNKEQGKWHYTIEFYQHEKIGPLEKRRLCLARTLGQKCPICDDLDAEKLKQNPSKTLLDTNKPKRRNLYNIWSHMPAEQEAKGVQLWDCSYHIFEKTIQRRAQIPIEGGSRIWMSPDAQHGKRIYFERSGKGVTDTEYINHEFVDRRMPLPAEIMAKAISLEMIIHIPTFDEVYEDWKQTPRDAGSTATYSVPTTQQPTAQISSQENRPEPGQAFTEQEQKQASIPTCPFGGIFGADCQKISFCGKCSVWDACAARQQELQGSKPAEVVTQPVETSTQEAKPVETTPTQTASAPIARRRRG
jgi:hypothetical protein